MLKNKATRDLALLIFMVTFTIIFLIYIFIPGSNDEEAEKTPPSNTLGTLFKGVVGDVNAKNDTLKTPQRKSGPHTASESVKKTESETESETESGTGAPASELRLIRQREKEKRELRCDVLSKKLELQLDQVYRGILQADALFETTRLEHLRQILEEQREPVLDKILKFSFYDLDEIMTLSFPPEYFDGVKFNIYLAVFALKLREERIETRVLQLPRQEYEKLMRFEFYRLIRNEINQDFQVMPLLFYYSVWMKRVDLYPVEDGLAEFRDRLDRLRDLSESKQLTRLKELILFNASGASYRIEWVEHDAIGSDDKKVYGNVALKTYRFLGQTYLVFPDSGGEEGALWIRELCLADENSIELDRLSIVNEDPAAQAEIKKILYAPQKSRFIVLLSEYRYQDSAGFLNAVTQIGITEFERKLFSIDFTAAQKDEDAFKSRLRDFGRYLQLNNIYW